MVEFWSFKNFKVKVTENGKVKVEGAAGVVTFNGDPALQRLGAKLKAASITFREAENGDIAYDASYHFYGAGSITLSGSFDSFELIQACSGLLCRAARALNTDRRKNRIMKEVMVD
ncbi:hypothetical protein [Salicola sp. Rm-C-2C1-2]|uniref:hypothetical protein n=1 Tax=Salicola sp. Rm-C-2C1-2 TaxID=3141321 RepID=UPI0032E47C9A